MHLALRMVVISRMRITQKVSSGDVLDCLICFIVLFAAFSFSVLE